MNKETMISVTLAVVVVWGLNHFAGNMLVAKKADGTLA
jgi:hypothetical protein